MTPMQVGGILIVGAIFGTSFGWMLAAWVYQRISAGEIEKKMTPKVMAMIRETYLPVIEGCLDNIESYLGSRGTHLEELLEEQLEGESRRLRAWLKAWKEANRC